MIISVDCILDVLYIDWPEGSAWSRGTKTSIPVVWGLVQLKKGKCLHMAVYQNVLSQMMKIIKYSVFCVTLPIISAVYPSQGERHHQVCGFVLLAENYLNKL